ncbi:MAG: dihydropteroate synthase [Candidatus Tokpelaia sp.]|nr:MAG: dihydropteroate synthase [Candidatus Tokpelaia sp.]KAA6207625.1 MAG: dihydropteroate synthase [Candidatus Tokpelaia sp.]
MVKNWHIKGGNSLVLGHKSLLMGILNVTPDSFSDGGSYFSPAAALAHAQIMQSEGADIIDIGGESTRPQAVPVSAAEEQRRILPVIAALSEQKPGLPLSVDTYRAETALAALRAGAHIINDVFGLQKDTAMADIIAATGAGLIIMHTGRERQKHQDPLADQHMFFSRSLEIAAKAGIRSEQIVLDPGFGFAKTAQENITLLRHAAKLQHFGLPLLAGISRKGFLGALSQQELPQQRDVAGAAGAVILRLQGFSLFRVHNIAVNRQALAVADALGPAAASA